MNMKPSLISYLQQCVQVKVFHRCVRVLCDKGLGGGGGGGGS